jgi:hypothetical protein
MGDTLKCPLCERNEATIKKRRGGFYLECSSPCYFMGPTGANIPQAEAAARRVASKRKLEQAA